MNNKTTKAKTGIHEAGIHEAEDGHLRPWRTIQVQGTAMLVDAIVERYQSGLLRYAQQWCGRFSSSCEVVQDTFVKLLEERKKHGSFQSESHLQAWLYRVCRQRAIDQHRKENRMRTSLDSEVVPDCDGDDPAELVSSRETHDQVQTELARLSVNQQEVVRLKFQVGMSYREIAEVTGLTVTNVGYLLHTAISSLKSKLT